MRFAFRPVCRVLFGMAVVLGLGRSAWASEVYGPLALGELKTAAGKNAAFSLDGPVWWPESTSSRPQLGAGKAYTGGTNLDTDPGTTFDGGGMLTLDSGGFDSGCLTIIDPGTIELSSFDSGTGGTTISPGTLVLNSTGNLAHIVDNTTPSGGTLTANLALLLNGSEPVLRMPTAAAVKRVTSSPGGSFWRENSLSFGPQPIPVKLNTESTTSLDETGTVALPSSGYEDGNMTICGGASNCYSGAIQAQAGTICLPMANWNSVEIGTGGTDVEGGVLDIGSGSNWMEGSSLAIGADPVADFSSEPISLAGGTLLVATSALTAATISPVPEPSTLVLLAVAAALAYFWRRRR